jgi:hypothetical protein
MNSQEANLVNYVGTVSSIVVLVIDTLNELLALYLKAKNDPKTDLKTLIWNKRLWFLQKIFDFPVSISS